MTTYKNGNFKAFHDHIKWIRWNSLRNEIMESSVPHYYSTHRLDMTAIEIHSFCLHFLISEFHLIFSFASIRNAVHSKWREDKFEMMLDYGALKRLWKIRTNIRSINFIIFFFVFLQLYFGRSLFLFLQLQEKRWDIGMGWFYSNPF